jgi:hypothetical protein
MVFLLREAQVGFKFCVSNDVLLNAIGTVGAASSEAKQTLPL